MYNKNSKMKLGKELCMYNHPDIGSKLYDTIPNSIRSVVHRKVWTEVITTVYWSLYSIHRDDYEDRL